MFSNAFLWVSGYIPRKVSRSRSRSTAQPASCAHFSTLQTKKWLTNHNPMQARCQDSASFVSCRIVASSHLIPSRSIRSLSPYQLSSSALPSYFTLLLDPPPQPSSSFTEAASHTRYSATAAAASPFPSILVSNFHYHSHLL